jgi:methionine-rich copper-binding protein CopC
MSTLKKVLVFLSFLTLFTVNIQPASAHTETETTSPSSGETVVGGEQLISVTFTDSILDLADSSEIVVVDSEGNVAPTDCSGIEKKKIYTNAFLATSGEYRVIWRTVAEDGHPITGKFSFQVSEDAATEYSKPACATDSPEPTPKVIAAPPVKTAAQPESGLSMPIALGALAVGAVLAIMWLVRKRKIRSKE